MADPIVDPIEAVETTPASAPASKPTVKWQVTTRGDVFQKPIVSVKPVEVAGVTKYVVNEMYWSTVRPAEDAAFVCLQHVTLVKGDKTQTSVNVVSFARASAQMSQADKIAAIKENPEVAMALATLLR